MNLKKKRNQFLDRLQIKVFRRAQINLFLAAINKIIFAKGFVESRFGYDMSTRLDENIMKLPININSGFVDMSEGLFGILNAFDSHSEIRVQAIYSSSSDDYINLAKDAAKIRLDVRKAVEKSLIYAGK